MTCSIKNTWNFVLNIFNWTQKNEHFIIQIILSVFVWCCVCVIIFKTSHLKNYNVHAFPQNIYLTFKLSQNWKEMKINKYIFMNIISSLQKQIWQLGQNKYLCFWFPTNPIFLPSDPTSFLRPKMHVRKNVVR